MALSEVEDGSQRVVFYYADPTTGGKTQEAASFKMGDLTGRWARFTLTVEGAEVSVLARHKMSAVFPTSRTMQF